VQGDVFWLASSEGLLRWDKKELTRLDFGEDFGRYPVSCVEVLDDQNILFSNSFGLFRFDVASGEYWLYDENSGLPSNTITNHGIFVTENKDVWIGTSYGLAFATRPLTETRRTRKPYCVEARVNGTPQRYRDGLHSLYGGYITLQFSPISFPENKINLQYRFSEEEEWISIQNRQLSLNNLEPGRHTIMVRAKKNTGLGWSEPTYLPIHVDLPYWQKIEFVFLIVFLIVLIAWASYAISSAIMNQRKKYLEDQISQRTQELQKANEELTVRNAELDRFVYSASHDLSAPLKSILGLILVAKLDQPGKTHEQYLNMMERSVHKLEDFIEEVVTYSRNTRMPVRLEKFSFKEFVESLLLDHEYSQNFKHIRFSIDDKLGGEMVSDLTRMKIILNNLLSNAIKFHWIDNCRDPYIRISVERDRSYYVLKVEDNGRGIRPEHIKHIFEMFYRATDDAQGSGLGLYILKEAVMKLGGIVEAESMLDGGTTFTIYLPNPEVAEVH
jgi:signal transduction histidine kinase